MVKKCSYILVFFCLLTGAATASENNPSQKSAVRLAYYLQPKFKAKSFQSTSLSRWHLANRFERFVTQPMPQAVFSGQESNSPAGSNRSVFLKSLVVPGWGQYALGAKTSARNFIISEVVLIGTSIGFNVYSNWLEDDFRQFAARHAGIQNSEQKSDQFWVDIGNFDSVRDFNEEKLRQRNTVDLRDVDGDEAWQWDSDQNRAIFEDLRIRRDRAAERSAFMIAGIVANHVISAIHAIWLSKKANDASASRSAHYRIVWENTARHDGGRLRLFYSF